MNSPEPAVVANRARTGHTAGDTLRAFFSGLRAGLGIAVATAPLAVPAAYVLGFTAWTTWISFTPSTLMPKNIWIGVENYTFILSSRNWDIAFRNILIYGLTFVSLTTVVGFLLAVLIDQRIRAENIFRSIFLYPLAVSFVVTGTVWRWLLNPELGIERLAHNLGWMSFQFNWITDRNMAIYTIALAGIWQASGFAMALFLAGIRSVEPEIIKAAEIDGARPWRIYLQIVLPTMRPVFVAVLIVLLQNAIKTFDLVRTLTNSGPGIATSMPATVVYDFMFQRGSLGRGAAAAVLMLLILVVVLAPYYLWKLYSLYRDWRVQTGS
jgi:glucose/mannose transport system permease protein